MWCEARGTWGDKAIKGNLWLEHGALGNPLSLGPGSRQCSLEGLNSKCKNLGLYRVFLTLTAV